MSQTIYGTVVTVLLDIGGPPIMLGRDILDATAILTDGTTAMTDLTNPVLSVNTTWGARDPRGILTDIEAGACVISIIDEARDLDPGNVDAVGIVNAGANAQVKVDGAPAFTGFIDQVSHDLATGVTTVALQDAVPRLSGMTVAATLTGGYTLDQAAQLMNAAGWPFGNFVIVGGSSGTSRSEDEIAMPVWAALNRLKDAELGDLWVARDGKVMFRPRNGDVPFTGPDVGDSPAIPLMDLTAVMRRASIVNHIVVDMTGEDDREYVGAGSIGRNGRRSYSQTQDDLRLI